MAQAKKDSWKVGWAFDGASQAKQTRAVNRVVSSAEKSKAAGKKAWVGIGVGGAGLVAQSVAGHKASNKFRRAHGQTDRDWFTGQPKKP
jgi:hypothetical protein